LPTQRVADYPCLDQPAVHERKLWNVARVCAVTISKALSPPNSSRKTTRAKTSPSSTTKTTYGKGLADETKKSLNKIGVTEKMFESYKQGRQGL